MKKIFVILLIFSLFLLNFGCTEIMEETELNLIEELNTIRPHPLIGSWLLVEGNSYTEEMEMIFVFEKDSKGKAIMRSTDNPDQEASITINYRIYNENELQIELMGEKSKFIFEINEEYLTLTRGNDIETYKRIN